MSAESSTPPKSDPELVECAVLEEVIDLLPIRLTVPELCLKIAADSRDKSKIEMIRHAIRDLRGWGLFRYRDDDQLVEPTQAAVHFFELFNR
ncbi:MAG TPA: hypothetical protein VIP57_06950 [Candidatus Dormibacteraeota bacterium]